MASTKPSTSVFVRIRGLDYHCRVWGPLEGPTLFWLHGWMDASASFQFMVDSLARPWRVIAPDWRGFGLTQWTESDTYWYADYLADLDMILEHFQPGEPVRLLGHSMGGSIACLYSGIRPERVAKLINLEGFGMSGAAAADAPARYAAWLHELGDAARMRDYENFDTLAARLRSDNPRLSLERSHYLAQHLGKQDVGRVTLRADPAQKRRNPVAYSVQEAGACWERITAPVLWVTASESRTLTNMGISINDLEQRKARFRQLNERIVPEAGHMMHLEQPERVARLVEEFLSDGET